MFSLFKLFDHRLFGKKVLGNSDISRPLTQKLYKSMIVLCTSPLKAGTQTSIDKYSGIVKSTSLWYCQLRSKNKRIYIPTSFIYDKIIEIHE
ncbi:hypothetical protein ENBRE01_2107 [Enteropsectra breve]|nr:hypothetical protein ENBRE01_2107 [Enteropsectra breve]